MIIVIVAIITVCEATKPVKLWRQITATAVVVVVVAIVAAATAAAADKSKPFNRGGFMSSFGVFFLDDLVLVLAYIGQLRVGAKDRPSNHTGNGNHP